MEAVASAAAVSKRTLYQRHSTKEELMQAVVEDRVRTWADDATARNSDLPDAFRERMICHAKTMMHSLGDPEVRQFDRLILQTAAQFPGIALTFYNIGYSYELQFLTDEIIRGTRDEPPPARRPKLIAQQLCSMILGWRRTEETVREIDPDEAAQFAVEAVNVLFKGRDNW
ncbi:TetR/AcrR family transcriptional regulator [Sphingobium sp. CAP-1]|uniref:TetR/AcrR family transcriptional regulator n=1 Tax=Sphingobium sp. CAP-1 TaxID=2676077 RepID=UPI001E401168|nr:TetR/AcrR family transcriptional regulator [Sphingobium sp. CAP-1]